MKKGTNILIRVSAEEKESFERAADLAGFNLSVWVRERLRSATVSELKKHGEAPTFLTKR